ncbi:MAG: DoxX family protein [Rhodobacteraceae bacterium]|nr:DoxX family protein [Paracoccaceae bacterium]
MTDAIKYAAPLGRILLSFMFIVSGWGKLGDPAGTAAYIQSGGLPGFLVWPTIALELIGGIFILVGFQTRITAFLLAGFSVVTGVLFHLVPSQGMEGMAQMMQVIMFNKNLSIAGGFLLLVALGAGPLSVDNRSNAGQPATA